MSSLVRFRFSVVAAIVAGVVCISGPAFASSTASWPELGHSNRHDSYSADPSITTGSAPSMGVKWMANIYSASLSSPVVAFNTKLNKTVAYIGTERGDLFAVDATTGQMLWSVNLGVGDAIRSTPAIANDGSVWVGTVYNPALYKLDGATGAISCSSNVGVIIDGSVMLADPPGGVSTAYITTNNNASGPGPLYAIRQSDCSTEFAFTKYVFADASSWTTPAFFVDSSGEPLLYIGTTDPDQHAYAVDANTGALVWTYFPTVGPGTWDLGAAATVGAKGSNGFAGGVVYLQTKYGVEYANDPATGKNIWSYQMFPNGYMGGRDARSGAALEGNSLVYGYQLGVDNLNAATGALKWEFKTPLEVVSSPAIAGPTGSEVVAFGDISGSFRLLSLSSGSQLYSYQTRGFITSSPAIANGTVMIASSDSFLYAYTVGGSNAAAPTTVISSPSNASSVNNPNGNLVIAGTATDPRGVSSVEVAVQQNGSIGPWLNGATGTFVAAPVRNLATLASPGATSTTWTYAFPAPAGGGSFQAFANSANSGHIVDKGARSSFTILPSNSQPVLTLSEQYAQPGTVFDVVGKSFSVGERVAFSLFGKVVATVATVPGTGHTPTVTINVAKNAPFGPTGVTATGLTSGKVSTAVIGITNEWTQLGYSASRTSFESNDPILVQILSIGKGTVLEKAWNYNAGAPINTSPAIVNGTAYVGTDAGTLVAVNTNSGAPLWTYATPSKSPIRSSPAIDGNGNAIFGSNDGNLYILGPSGALIKTVALGGSLNSPSTDNGNVYITSTTGNLYDVAEPAGTIVWTKALGATSHSSPSYDSSANVVVVGDDAGNITAFDSTTGAQKWKVTTGGAVTGPPAIQNGKVIVGSADSRLYSIDETTGSVVWKFVADGAIGAGVALNGIGTISFGSSRGTLYLVSSAGTQLYAQTRVYHDHPIVGVSALENNTVAETSAGFVGITRLDAGLPQYPLFEFQSKSTFSTTPAIIDGAVYIAGNDGNLYAFTPHGVNPVPALKPGPVITITDAWTCTTP